MNDYPCLLAPFEGNYLYRGRRRKEIFTMLLSNFTHDSGHFNHGEIKRMCPEIDMDIQRGKKGGDKAYADEAS